MLAPGLLVLRSHVPVPFLTSVVAPLAPESPRPPVTTLGLVLVPVSVTVCAPELDGNGIPETVRVPASGIVEGDGARRLEE